MFNVSDLLAKLDQIAPLELSYKMIESGEYDNSGLLIKTHNQVGGVLFSLDLTVEAVKRAKKLKCDTIVTHHPAIYHPVKRLSIDEDTAAVVEAVKANLNVISYHLNLDVADGGIDQSLCEGLGGINPVILDYLDKAHGYGREFILNEKLSEVKKRIIKEFKTDKIIVYGGGKTTLKKAASFCGGGAGHALSMVSDGKTDADLIITSDMPHHVIKELTERGKCIIILPHYCAEEYGFKKFYKKASEKICGAAYAEYFSDKRFY